MADETTIDDTVEADTPNVTAPQTFNISNPELGMISWTPGPKTQAHLQQIADAGELGSVNEMIKDSLERFITRGTHAISRWAGKLDETDDGVDPMTSPLDALFSALSTFGMQPIAVGVFTLHGDECECEEPETD